MNATAREPGLDRQIVTDAGFDHEVNGLLAQPTITEARHLWTPPENALERFDRHRETLRHPLSICKIVKPPGALIAPPPQMHVYTGGVTSLDDSANQTWTRFRDVIGAPERLLDLRVTTKKPVVPYRSACRYLELTAKCFKFVERRL